MNGARESAIAAASSSDVTVTDRQANMACGAIDALDAFKAELVTWAKAAAARED